MKLLIVALLSFLSFVYSDISFLLVFCSVDGRMGSSNDVLGLTRSQLEDANKLLCNGDSQHVTPGHEVLGVRGQGDHDHQPRQLLRQTGSQRSRGRTSGVNQSHPTETQGNEEEQQHLKTNLIINCEGEVFTNTNPLCERPRGSFLLPVSVIDDKEAILCNLVKANLGIICLRSVINCLSSQVNPMIRPNETMLPAVASLVDAPVVGCYNQFEVNTLQSVILDLLTPRVLPAAQVIPMVMETPQHPEQASGQPPTSAPTIQTELPFFSPHHLPPPPYVPVKDVPVKRPSKPVWNLPEESPDIEFLRTSRVFPPLASTEEAVLMREKIQEDLQTRMKELYNKEYPKIKTDKDGSEKN